MSPGLYLLLGLLGGALLGLVLGWWLGGQRWARAEGRLEEELRQQLGRRELELSQSQAESSAQSQQIGKWESQAQQLEERLSSERQQLESLQSRFHKEFEAIAHKLLLDNSSRFGQQSVQSLDKLLEPLRQNLADFRGRLETVHSANLEHSALLREQVGRIGSEAANLAKALKGEAKVLGNWGELMLEQLLERSGLQAGLHYRRQSPALDGAGEQRFLDVLVHLPEQKHLIIDSKVSLRAYEQYVNCSEEKLRAAHLANHIECLRTHVRALAAKRYQELSGLGSPDFVLMYVPIEGAYFAALSQEPDLAGEALEKNIVLITNSTLLATLRTVSHVWRLADQQQHALEIAARGGRLYDKFVGFISDLQEIGASLKKGQEVWEEASKKLYQGPGNLVRQVEQLRSLGVKAAKALPAELTALARQESEPVGPTASKEPAPK